MADLYSNCAGSLDYGLEELVSRPDEIHHLEQLDCWDMYLV